MSTSPVPPPTSRPGSSDLAKLCLPSSRREAEQGLAYVVSICLLFLVVGLIGLRPPLPTVVPSPADVEVVPVVFVPPEASPPPEMALAEVIVADNPVATLDRPTVVPVTAAATLPSPQPTVPLTSAAFPVPAAPHAMPECRVRRRRRLSPPPRRPPPLPARFRGRGSIRDKRVSNAWKARSCWRCG